MLLQSSLRSVRAPYAVPMRKLTVPRPSVRLAAAGSIPGDEEKSKAEPAGSTPPTPKDEPRVDPAAAPVPAKVAEEDNFLEHYGKLGVAMAALYAVDTVSKKAFLSAGITFPSSLVLMMAIPLLLIVMGEKIATPIRNFMTPALDWIAKWLPLFYVASLVTLPLALAGLTSAELLKILAILSFGMCGTLLFTAYTTVFIRNLVKTENKTIAKAKKATPFINSHYMFWGSLAFVSIVATVFSGVSANTFLLFGLAATVGGYLIGNLVPGNLHGILHPVVVTALVANAGCAVYAAVGHLSYNESLKMYLAKGTGPMGAGDLLMSFLGSVIISMGFRIYDQRETMKRHATEILGATFLSAVFSFFSTAFAARALGLSVALSTALIPRSVTVALALPIAGQLDAPLAITAAAVLLQGLLGANFGPGLMTACGIKDTIARGLAAAGTAGGLGTASLTSKEPEALPFCALSYSLVGILSTLLVATPPIRSALLAICGA